MSEEQNNKLAADLSKFTYQVYRGFFEQNQCPSSVDSETLTVAASNFEIARAINNLAAATLELSSVMALKAIK